MGSTVGNDLSSLFEVVKPFKLGFARIRINKVTSAAGIRMVRPDGVRMFKESMRENGFLHDLFISVFMDKDHFDAVKDMFDEQKKKAEDAGVITTHHRVDDAELDQVVPKWKCIDGMHRTTALQELLGECEKEEDKARYQWASACIYTPDVKPKICALAKAINAQGAKCVPEDNLERITFMQKMIQSWATETKVKEAEAKGDTEGVNQYLQEGAEGEEAEKVTFFFSHV